MDSGASSVLEDPNLALDKIPHYWLALKQRAIAGVHGIDVSTALPAKSSLYPARVYAQSSGARVLAEQLRADLDAETACFDRGMLTKPATWKQLAGVGRLVDYDLVPDVSEEDHARLADALAMIRAYWPQAAQEYMAHVRGIVWIKHRETYSGSDPKLYGVIFLNKAYFRAHAIVEMATDIVHESAHHTLFVESAIDPMFAGDFAKQIYSPIRQGDRPAIGVLHGVFSMLRMLMWSRHLTSKAPARADFRAEQDRMDALFRDGLKPAIADLSDVGLTPGGRALVDAMARVEKRLYG